MKAKCRKCGDTVEVTRPREYKTCKCGAIALDYGDPPYYYRVSGDPKDFDGEIEGAPKIHTGDIIVEHFHPEQTETTIKFIDHDGYKVKSRQMGKQGAIADAKIAEQACEYLNKFSKVKESFRNVNVDLCEDGTLYIDDAETDEQLAKFKVVEGEQNEHT